MSFYQFFIDKFTRAGKQLNCIMLFMFLISVYFSVVLVLQLTHWFFLTSLFLAGWFIWTFFEYILHRFWMHNAGHSRSVMSDRHHHHHTHPTDIKVTAIQRVGLFLITIAFGLLSVYMHSCFMVLSGVVFGFAGYTMMHWTLHQRWSAKLFPRLQRFHIYHHCKFPDTCYGISVCWWDLLFKTTPPGETDLLKRVIDFYFEGNQKKK